MLPQRCQIVRKTAATTNSTYVIMGSKLAAVKIECNFEIGNIHFAGNLWGNINFAGDGT